MKAGSINIHHWKNNVVPNQTIDCSEDMFKTMLQLRLIGFSNRNRHYYGLYNKQTSYIFITNHALARWNERIGPIMELSYLQGMFNSLWKEPERIVFIDRDIGILDNEIVFTVEMEKTRMIVTTFLGRISYNPALQSISQLQKIKHNHKNMLDLTIPPHLLYKQLPPLMPGQVMIFSGSKYVYKLEEYRFDPLMNQMVYGVHHYSHYRTRTYLITFNPMGSTSIRELLPSKKIGKSVLTALRIFNSQSNHFGKNPAETISHL